MRNGRIGVTLLTVGFLSLMLQPSSTDTPAQVLGIGLLRAGVLGAGAIALALVRPSPLHSAWVHRGLGMLGVGIWVLGLSLIAPIPAGGNSLESVPYLLAMVGGLGAMGLGAVLAVLALLLSPGTPQRARWLFAGGLVGVLLFRLLGGSMAGAPLIVGLAGGLGAGAVWLSVGFLVLRAVWRERFPDHAVPGPDHEGSG